ncbi:HAMP domain-containing histidine kinase [Paenibacillus sp. IB182496]|uniref:histidine kinase n=2 Tax=Paenibacillus sabuli TaxID=2772509 RepID=A0A927BRW9_9BACL|nr:HAMP domain-containing histidine kinase [Paenibacillus sabuli]
MRISIKVKLSLLLTVLIVAAVAILARLVLQGIDASQRAETERELARQSEIAGLRVRQAYMLGDRKDDDEFLRLRGQGLAMEISRQSGLPVVIYDRAGEPVGNSLQQLEALDIRDTLDYALSGRTAYQVSGASLVYMAPLAGSAGQVGVVQFYYSLQTQQAFHASIKRLFLTTGAAVAGAGLLIGYLYLHRFSGAIYRLRDLVGAIRRGDYPHAAARVRGDELGELEAGIYYMSDAIRSNIDGLQAERHKLTLAVTKLQALEQRQKQFIGSISHEFKTPLTSIRAYGDLLEMYADDPELVAEAQVNISREAQRLQEMVDKVLRLSALEKYEFESEAGPVAVDELLGELCGRLRGKAARFGISLESRLESAAVWGDRELLSSIFMNVLDNAIKYNVRGGEVCVTCAQEDGRVRVAIADTGLGIPAEERARIFEPFYTVSKDRARRTGGSGLGLALVREMTDKQGGEIAVEAACGARGGTRFILTFPGHSSERSTD